MGRTSDAKDKLLVAAIELIWANSYSSISVDQICERAGVKKGSFYHFFPSKEELALEAYEQHWREDVQPRLERIFDARIPPLARIASWCDEIFTEQKAHFDSTGQVPGCPMCSLGSEGGAQTERLRRKAEELLERGAFHLERALRDADRAGQLPSGDPLGKARTLTALAMGAMLQAKLHNDPQPLLHLKAQVFELLQAPMPA
jgi:TetR/AcrR family transcriptional regulator, transcriptional repressor for nem operon